MADWDTSRGLTRGNPTELTMDSSGLFKRGLDAALLAGDEADPSRASDGPAFFRLPIDVDPLVQPSIGMSLVQLVERPLWWFDSGGPPQPARPPTGPHPVRPLRQINRPGWWLIPAGQALLWTVHAQDRGWRVEFLKSRGRALIAALHVDLNDVPAGEAGALATAVHSLHQLESLEFTGWEIPHRPLTGDEVAQWSDALASIPQLRHLSIPVAPTADAGAALMDLLSRLPTLERLVINCSLARLDGRWLHKGFSRLTTLRDLCVNSNLNRAASESLAALPALRRLHVWPHHALGHLTDETVTTLLRAPSLRELDVGAQAVGGLGERWADAGLIDLPGAERISLHRVRPWIGENKRLAFGTDAEDLELYLDYLQDPVDGLPGRTCQRCHEKRGAWFVGG